MKRFLLGILLLGAAGVCGGLRAQNNNPVSLYEGTIIQSVDFEYLNPPADTMLRNAYVQVVESEFRITPQSQFNSFLASYYASKLNLLPFVAASRLSATPTGQNQVAVTVSVTFTEATAQPKRENAARDLKLLPVLYNSERTYLTLKAAASEMVYSNNNAWFAQPTAMTTGNPLADHPPGAGYSAWLEGFGSAGLYGITKLVPAINLHLYGGVNYLVSFSAGNELFTQKARIYGGIEEAFIGLIGGGRSTTGKIYRYNFTYGRKQFTLGDGWLIINTSMNGYNRAALQLNPRWAADRLISGGFSWDFLTVQGFSLKADELDILNSHSTIAGANVELTNQRNGVLGLTFLTVPESKFRYFLPDGTVHTREGLQVFNLRLFRNTGDRGGLFFKAEAGYERNTRFDMSAFAFYGELGWAFKHTKGSPTVSYRFAYFSGDNPDTKSYNRWDALYTGGNGEQWVQGSNMYKVVQNSNEMTHRFQCAYRPVQKLQLVGQVWLFYAPQKNNIGGNPALSNLESRDYGTEFNFTVKYFHSRRWYFHLNTAYTLPGGAIRDAIPHTRNWYCLSAFARYSF